VIEDHPHNAASSRAARSPGRRHGVQCGSGDCRLRRLLQPEGLEQPGWAAILVLAAAVVYGVALWRAPSWMHATTSQDRYNARVLVTSVGGAIVVGAGLLYTARKAAGLAHAETQFLAKRLALRSLAEGRNLLFAISMASRSARSPGSAPAPPATP
jgi:hypothetical protein